MFKKPLEKPILLRKLLALERRLPKNHEKYPKVQLDLKNRLSGYHGERNLSYYLSFLSNNDNFIYHDLRLPTVSDPNKFFQMDWLILSHSFIPILESKNFTGEICCDSTYNQIINIYENRKKRYQDPLAQVMRQRFHLNRFLERYEFPAIPIEYLVVFTNENCILTTDNKGHPFAQRFLHAEHLVDKISAIKSNYKPSILSFKRMEELNRLLLEKHTPEDKDLLEYYHISPNELLKGAFCPQCGCLPMQRNYGKWICPACGFSSKDAHVQAIDDYFLLVKPWITNSECREFLCLDSIDTAKRILLSLNLGVEGSKKSRKYFVESKKVNYSKRVDGH